MNLQERLEATVNKAEVDVSLLHQVVHGNNQTDVVTESGPVKTVAKAIHQVELDLAASRTELTAQVGEATRQAGISTSSANFSTSKAADAAATLAEVKARADAATSAVVIPTKTWVGNGTQTDFALDYAVGHPGALQVTVASVLQTPVDAYSLFDSRTLRFVTAQPGRKGNVRVLKISLGLLCNYACTYCSQRFVPHADQTNPENVESFLRSLEDALIEPPERIEFWGGEPLVYWKTLKPLAECLRSMYPKAQFSMITNGSLLDADKNAWIDRLGFSVGLSHDGPGYHARGTDPLDDPQKRAAIFDLYARLKPEGRISINAMIHANNPSRAHVQSWLRERFGEDVVIGEGAFIDPYDEGGLASTFQTSAERITFSAYAFKELRAGAVTNFDIGRKKIMDFVESVAQGRPASALGQKCGMDRTDNLSVDLNGNVLTCQNVSAAAVAPNGESHKIGHISQLQAVKMRSATHWSKREECSSCPVLQLCKGSCMFLDGPLWTAGCDASYADNVPFFAAGIEFLTGCFPFYIEGDVPQERRDIFGLVSEHSEVKERRVIPIMVEHA